MRVTGGKARGIQLNTGRGSAVRPATDRLREAVFSSLGDWVEGRRFFDLFAGSGAYGLDAWSRGAKGGLFVEKNRVLVQAIRNNIRVVARSLGEPEERVGVIATDVIRWRPVDGERPDMIFVDPPYEIIPDVVPGLFAKFDEWIDFDGVIVFEMPGGLDVAPIGWECFKRLGQGKRQPSCCFFRKTR